MFVVRFIADRTNTKLKLKTNYARVNFFLYQAYSSNNRTLFGSGSACFPYFFSFCAARLVYRYMCVYALVDLSVSFAPFPPSKSSGEIYVQV